MTFSDRIEQLDSCGSENAEVLRTQCIHTISLILIIIKIIIIIIIIIIRNYAVNNQERTDGQRIG